MGKIKVLDQITIDKIAAGEVIERPASIVKELVENAIDAGADSITTEIKEGGISLIRITDNGCGIDKEDVPGAFLRHSTSKISKIEDLNTISSLGFRGEALSSIAAIAQVELITKTKESDFGTSYRIEGGKEIAYEDTGAPDGTTFLIRQIFYNTPARRKFLKTPMTEASHVGELITRLAISHPEVSFRFLNNGQEKLHTSGNGEVKDVIYHIFGRDVASNLIEVNHERNGIKITGYIGAPVINRGNRNYENYFVNGRYMKNNIVAKGIEDAYKGFTMQHKYPFTVLYISLDKMDVDINVHPAKMEVRFSNQQSVYQTVYEAVSAGLNHKVLIPEAEIPEPKKAKEEIEQEKQSVLYNRQNQENAQKDTKQSALYKLEKPYKPSISGQNTIKQSGYQKIDAEPVEKDLDYFMKRMKERVLSYHNQNSSAEVKERTGIFKSDLQMDRIKEAARYRAENEAKQMEASKKQETLEAEITFEKEMPAIEEPIPAPSIEEQKQQEELEALAKKEEKAHQMNLFDDHMVKRQFKAEYRIIGQVFSTYWMVEFDGKLYIIDQHAAHERVLYEKTKKGLSSKEHFAQYVNPPIILDLSMKEAELLNAHMDSFTRVGFEIEPFGQDAYAVRSVPANLFSLARKDLLLEMLDDLSDEIYTGLTPEIIEDKIATMSCKAAVKGNMNLSYDEADALIGELLQLENPYHCPHGRPTMITISKYEMEKKFKRIVS